MPLVFTFLGYPVYFWSNENKPLEDIHVHVSKQQTQNATKIWINSDGSVELEHNNSKIPPKDLKKLLFAISMYSDMIIGKWENHFGCAAKFHDIGRGLE